MACRFTSRPTGLLGALLVLGATACVDERVVFQDRELFEDPLTEAGSFLGYTDHEDKLTVCGNCHIGVQGDWQVTGHAAAWDGLQDSGHAQELCQGCHTVSQLGNVTTDIGGHAATGEERYEDVQCEACHGPGLDHVLDPSDETAPLAAVAVGLDLTLGCGECHQGAHHSFVDEWAESGHALINPSPAGNPSCTSCHTGEGALQMLGVRTTYLEEATVAQPDEHLAITCAVCHDPHGSENSAQLRLPIDVPSEEENLCMQCHHKRGIPDPTTFRGPHSPEGPLLLGTAGWWPPDMTFPGGRIVATHGSEANPRLCASCHVRSFEVLDDETEELVFQSTGHSFEATPCVDGNGVPTGGDCAEEERSFAGCVASGCHSSEESTISLKAIAESRIAGHAADLEDLLATIPEAEFDPDDGRYSAAEGSRFNLELARFNGSAVHNPFLVEALLLASIQELEARYGPAAPPASGSAGAPGGR